MSAANCNMCLLLTLCLAAILIPLSTGQCPIPESDLENYIETSDDVFATPLQAEFENIPGSPLGGVRVSWELTHPDCIRSVCVRIEKIKENENDEREIVAPIQCPEDVSLTSLLMEEVVCNTNVRAVLEVAAGESGRSTTSDEIYIGGNPSLLPGTPPPNLQAYLDNDEVVLTWGEVECLQQNSRITLYNVQFNATGEDTQLRLVNSPLRMIRSSSMKREDRLFIPELTQRYQFRVGAVNKNGFGPLSSALDRVPADLDPLPTTAPPTTAPPTTPPPTTPPPTTQPPQTTQPPTRPPSTSPPSTPPPTTPGTQPPTTQPLQTTTTSPPTTTSTKPPTRPPPTTPSSQPSPPPTTPVTTPTTPTSQTTTPTSEETSTETTTIPGPASTGPLEVSTQDPAREGIIGVVVGVMVVVIVVLLTLSGLIMGCMIWRNRKTWREWRAKKKRLSISGPIPVNDMFVEVKRDSQLLEAGSRPNSRGSFKKKKDKNIYDELKASEPKIRSYKRNIHVGGGEQVTLKVEFTGFPKPSIDWFYEGMRLDANSLNGREILNDGSIFIKEASRKHTGTYDFIVSNSLGNVEGCTKLIVYVEEKVDSSTVDRRKKNGTKLESHMVKKEKFPRHVSHCHTFNNKGFTAEFQSLLTWEEDERTTVGRTGENRFKNRYKNITPYDKNRLTLDPMNHPDCQYDYINASYVDGYSRPKRYIAAQGPLTATLLDFWRLIWQEKVQTIVMVTSLSEGRHKMCEQYWPDSGCVEYGPFMVTLVETQVFADYVIRTFQLLTRTSDQSGNVRNIRKVTQYQFLSWPDHGIPEHPGPLLAYLKRVKSVHKPTMGPILMHCSAGVGRTGTLMTIDIAMGQAAQEEVIDIAGIVCRIRSQRMKMVQTPEQYAFIHDAVLEGITCGDTQIPASGFKKALTKLADRKNDKEPTGFEKQFEILETVSPQASDLPRTVALRCSSKNRSNDYLPCDGSRVWLQAQNMEKTYIHASYINGYKQKNAFIITQAPMENTTEDFWRMVYERDCAVVVMLSGMEELEEECCYCYWPDSQAKSAINGEKHGAYTIFTLERKREEGFLVRTFGITDPKGENMRRVVQFQMAGWSQDGVCINPVALMKMLDKLMIAQRRTGDKPIVVHGSNTVSRCAVFCALLNCIDSCKCESVVDVFQTVKALRLQKPGAIQTVEQYSCVYELMSLYLSSFSLYSNFK